MKFLAVDTATEVCGVALADEGSVVAEVRLNQRNVHNEKLLELIQVVTDQVDWPLSDLDGIVYSKGPGSFTGLRIGITVCKGLAYALSKPLIGINTMDALAYAVLQWPGSVAVYLKARQNEGYLALYKRSLCELKRISDYQIVPLSDIATHLNDQTLVVSVPADFISSADLQNVQLAPPHYSLLQPWTFPQLALEKWHKKAFADPDVAEPFYLKNFQPKRKTYYE